MGDADVHHLTLQRLANRLESLPVRLPVIVVDSMGRTRLEEVNFRNPCC